MPKKIFSIPSIGMRNIKTALSATLCAFLYLLINRNPTFACIGAVFGLGSDLPDSWRNGGNRLIGTIIGGFLGMGLFTVYLYFCPERDNQILLLPLLFVGVVVLILCSQFFHWPGAVQPGGVVLCILLYNTHPDAYIAYSLNRMLDTGIGVVISLLVNLYLTPDRLALWFSPFQRKANADK